MLNMFFVIIYNCAYDMLFRLKEKVENDWHIRPACLPPPTFVEYGNKPTGFKFKVSGWGVTETGKGTLYKRCCCCQ
jgi:hypothetical protein